MAKSQNKGTGAKVGKNKKFKKRERKNVPFGLVFIQATFQQHDRDDHGPAGQYAELEELGFAGLPRIAQGYAVRGAAGSGWSSYGGS